MENQQDLSYVQVMFNIQNCMLWLHTTLTGRILCFHLIMLPIHTLHVTSQVQVQAVAQGIHLWLGF